VTVRVVGFLACVLTLAALSFYSARVGATQVDTIPEIVAREGIPSGQEVALTSDVTITGVGANDFTAEQGGAAIRVLIPARLRTDWEAARAGIKAGDHVSLRGIYRGAGYLEARDFHVHKGRRLKIWVSLAALLAAGLIVVKQAREGKNA